MFFHLGNAFISNELPNLNGRLGIGMRESAVNLLNTVLVIEALHTVAPNVSALVTAIWVLESNATLGGAVD